MSLSILFILMLYIIIFARLRRKIVAINMFLIWKLLDFRIFLLYLLLTLKTIILLKRLISCMSFCALNILTMSKLHINAIIFIALILCTLFVFFFLLVYAINFIFLVDCRFKSACLMFILIVIFAINNKLYIILVYVFASCVSFLILFTFFS